MQKSQYLKHFATARVRDLLQKLAGSRVASYELGAETPIQTFYHGKLFDPLKVRSGLEPILGLPPSGLAPHECDLSALQLLGTILFEVDSDRSYFGDCINVVDVPNLHNAFAEGNVLFKRTPRLWFVGFESGHIPAYVLT